MATQPQASMSWFHDHQDVMRDIESKRLEANLGSQAELCRKLDINPATYSRVKNGLEPIPSGWVINLAELLGVRTEDLVKKLYPPSEQQYLVDVPDLEYMGEIVKAAGKPVRLSLLLQLLRDKKV